MLMKWVGRVYGGGPAVRVGSGTAAAHARARVRETVSPPSLIPEKMSCLFVSGISVVCLLALRERSEGQRTV